MDEPEESLFEEGDSESLLEEWNNWPDFDDPVASFRDQSAYKNNKRIVRDLDEIEISMDDYAGKSLSDLASLDIPTPTGDAENNMIICNSLLHLTCVVQETLGSIATHGSTLSAQNVEDFDSVRQRLMIALFSLAAKSETHAFQIGQKHCVYRLDTFIFRGFLQCQSCILSDPRMYQQVKDTTPSEFTLLVKKGAVPRTLLKRQIVEFRLGDIISSLKYLKDKWLTLPYSSDLFRYLDLLTARLGVVFSAPQPEHIYGSIEDYKEPVEDGLFSYTPRLLEDMCWTFVPMYKKMQYHEILASTVDRSVEVSTEKRNAVEDMVTQNALNLENKTLIETYSNLYTKCGLRPSEKAKFRRDFKSTTETHPAIIDKIRGKQAKRNIMEKLARAPWIIVREKLFERPMRDLLMLLLIDSYVSNLANISWFNTFIETNIELVHSPNPLDYCDKHYPIIVQHFNHFGLYYRNVLYPHDSAAKSFIHWLAVMMQPPFNGKWSGKSLKELSYRIPSLDASLPTTLS